MFGANVVVGQEIIDVQDERIEILLARIQEEVRSRFALAQEDAPRCRITAWMTLDDESMRDELQRRMLVIIGREIQLFRRKLDSLDAEQVIKDSEGTITQQDIADFRAMATREPSEEMQRLQSLPVLPEHSLALLQQEYAHVKDSGHPFSSFFLETQMKYLGLLSCDRETPPLDDFSLQQRLQGLDTTDLDGLIGQYAAMRVLNIPDPNIRRLCTAMREVGLDSYSSCEGHGSNLPYISFGASEHGMRAFQDVLDRHSGRLREQWIINPGIHGGKEMHVIDEYRDEDDNGRAERPTMKKVVLPPTTYTLTVEDWRGEEKLVSERYDQALSDIDVIGLLLHQLHKAQRAE